MGNTAGQFLPGSALQQRQFLASRDGGLSLGEASITLRPEDFGAKADGTTDDSSALSDTLSKLQDLGGGTLLLRGTYGTSGKLTLDNTARIVVEGGGKIIYSGTDAAFELATTVSASAFDIRHILRSVTIAKKDNDCVGSGVRIRDCVHQRLEHLVIQGFAIGVEHQITTDWCEAHTLDSLLILDCIKGLSYDRTAGNFSFSSQSVRRCIVAQTTANTAASYGIYIGNACDLYRSDMNVTVFLKNDGDIAYYCDGKIRNVSGSWNVERSAGATQTAYSFGAHASSINARLTCDIRGAPAAFFAFDGSLSSGQMMPWIDTAQFGTETGLFRLVRAGVKNTVWGAGSSADLSSIYDKLVISSAGQPIHLHDIAIGTRRYRDLTETYDARLQAGFVRTLQTLSGGETQADVRLGSHIYFTNASATSITDFLNGVDGQEICVEFANANTVLKYNAGTSGSNIITVAAADLTGAANRLYKFVKRSSAWRQVS